LPVNAQQHPRHSGLLSRENCRPHRGLEPFLSVRNGWHQCTMLVKIMLTLMNNFSLADRRTPWVTDQHRSKEERLQAWWKFAERFAGRDSPS
jgi:hypothetical protein